jgi:Glycosyl hydrolase catalytic core
MNELNAAWYYTYAAENVGKRGFAQYGVPWVPMVWAFYAGYPDVNSTEYILGFNEPDLAADGGHAVPPEENLLYWPLIEAVNARRIGAPSNGFRNLLTWMPIFLAGNATYKPKVDFISLHWYGNNASQFLEFVDLAWTILKMPIWVTEYSMADWHATLANPSKLTMDDAIAFNSITQAGLESRPFIEHSDINRPAHSFCSMFYLNKTITPLGIAHAMESPYSASPTVVSTTSFEAI